MTTWVRRHPELLAILAVLSPVLLVVALAVKWTSEGPILFRQERLGLHARVYR